MCERQAHRGPDSRGIFSADGVGLGIQRLRVIDLETGDQPVYNEDRSVVVVLNGEIYNYRELRRELEGRGHAFSTHGDTEVIVHLYEEEGPDLVQRLSGMFAFALWDQRRERLLIARDRVGKKPLFYSEQGGSLSFASELGALMADPTIPREVDAAAIDCYLAYGYIQAPRSIWSAVKKLPPAHTLAWEDGKTSIERYWRLDYSRKADAPLPELEEELRSRVSAAVRRRMIADVPLGALLSGGVDSAIVVSEMAAAAPDRVKTFSIGFAQEEYNELPLARLTAERFGTDHEEFTVEPDAIEIVPKLVRHYGEPFADSSAIPSFYLAELTRRAGDGGAERRRRRRELRRLPPLRRQQPQRRPRPRAAAAAPGCRRRRRAPAAARRRPRAAQLRAALPHLDRRGRAGPLRRPRLHLQPLRAWGPARRGGPRGGRDRDRGRDRRPLARCLREQQARRPARDRRRHLPPRRPAGQDGHRLDGLLARGALAPARPGADAVRRLAASPLQGAAHRQEVDPAARLPRTRPGRGAGRQEARLRGPPRRLVPQRAARLHPRSPARPGVAGPRPGPRGPHARPARPARSRRRRPLDADLVPADARSSGIASSSTARQRRAERGARLRSRSRWPLPGPEPIRATRAAPRRGRRSGSG